MTGIGKSTKTITATGTQVIDGLLSGLAWSGTVTYAFPTSVISYGGSGYSQKNEHLNKFGSVSTAQKIAAKYALDASDGNSANNGFSVEGFTRLAVSAGSTTTANLRLAESRVPETAWGYYPWTDKSGGDIWFNKTDYRAPVAGNYAWATMLHEIGHALGLKHGHEADVDAGFPSLPRSTDSMEYSIMTYRANVGANPYRGYMNERYGYAQSYMMYDIAALQRMYGADFTTNSGDTIYKWRPTSGDTLVNGKVAIDAGGNRIFATIWDGGGTDTYDLASYTRGVSLDLRPGSYSKFSSVQLANLDSSVNAFARGNIFNALLYNGDLRSLIENARGGSGNDNIRGNQGENSLSGRNGNDKLKGYEGNDKLYGGSGTDTLDGGSGNDILTGGAQADKLIGGDGWDTASYKNATKGVVANLLKPSLNSGDARGDSYSSVERLFGSSYGDKLTGDGGVNRINGYKGNDTLTGGGGADDFVFAKGYGRDMITDFENDIDRIDLRSYAFSSVNSVLEKAVQSGADLHIKLGSTDIIVLKNFAKADLDATDFLL